MLEPIKKNNYKSLYLANLNRKYLVDNNKVTEISDFKYITSGSDLSISEQIIFTKLRSGI